MLEKWAGVVYRRPWRVLIIGLVLLFGGGIYGTSVFNHLDTGNDFEDPASASAQVEHLAQARFANTQGQLLILYSSPKLSVTSPSFKATVQSNVTRIAGLTDVIRIQSYYNTGDRRLVSLNGRATYVAVSLGGTNSQQQHSYNAIIKLLPSELGALHTQVGGVLAVNEQINHQVTSDLKRAESLSLPIVAVRLVLIFGNVVAAVVPLFLGGLSILGALFITRLLTSVTTMSSYVINVITLLGLGLAIDYSLFLVGRYREELIAHDSPKKALAATIQHAGRTIMFSGSTVIISLLSLIVFPQVFLRSMGMAGAAVVATAVILALSVVPASLSILGKHINDLSLPGRHLNKSAPARTGFWYRFSQFVMRRPVLVLVLALLILMIIGSQFLHATLSQPDISSVPTSFSSYQVNRALESDFSGTNTEPINLIIQTSGSPVSVDNLKLLNHYTNQLRQLKTVTGIDSVASHLASSVPVAYQQPLISQYVSGNYEQLSVYQSSAAQSAAAQTLIKNIRALSAPSGFRVYVGGVSASLVDLLHSLREHLPYALIIIFCATVILIFLLMGGVVVPIKAIVLGILSLSAAFGTLVWVFQDRHFSSFLSLAAEGSIDATSAILIFAIAFGLSMDYEFFLLSRIKEEYELTGDNVHSVAHGVQKTAGIITSAALLLISVIGLFTISKISLIEQIGLGLAVAVAIDSTLVRMILVPATMRLLGKANWWAPKPLRALYARFGLHD